MQGDRALAAQKRDDLIDRALDKNSEAFGMRLRFPKRLLDQMGKLLVFENGKGNFGVVDEAVEIFADVIAVVNIMFKTKLHEDIGNGTFGGIRGVRNTG